MTTDVRKLRIEAALNLVCDALDAELKETLEVIRAMNARITQLEEATGNDTWTTLIDRMDELEDSVREIRDDSVTHGDMERYVDTTLSDFAVTLADDDNIREGFKEAIAEYFRENTMVIRPAD